MSGATLVVRRARWFRPRASARWGRPARRCPDRSTGTSTCGRSRRRRPRGTSRRAAASRIASTIARDVGLDAGEVLGVGLELDGIGARVDAEVLVADPEPELRRPAAPRARPGTRARMSSASEPSRGSAGLVVADVEDAVVLPHRVEPAGRRSRPVRRAPRRTTSSSWPRAGAGTGTGRRGGAASRRPDRRWAARGSRASSPGAPGRGSRPGRGGAGAGRGRGCPVAAPVPAVALGAAAAGAGRGRGGGTAPSRRASSATPWGCRAAAARGSSSPTLLTAAPRAAGDVRAARALPPRRGRVAVGVRPDHRDAAPRTTSRSSSQIAAPSTSTAWAQPPSRSARTTRSGPGHRPAGRRSSAKRVDGASRISSLARSPSESSRSSRPPPASSSASPAGPTSRTPVRRATVSNASVPSSATTIAWSPNCATYQRAASS